MWFPMSDFGDLGVVGELAYFSKVRALHKGELGFARYGPTSRGRWNVLHVGGSFSDRDSDLTGEALDDPRVAHCS